MFFVLKFFNFRRHYYTFNLWTTKASRWYYYLRNSSAFIDVCIFMHISKLTNLISVVIEIENEIKPKQTIFIFSPLFTIFDKLFRSKTMQILSLYRKQKKKNFRVFSIRMICMWVQVKHEYAITEIRMKSSDMVSCFYPWSHNSHILYCFSLMFFQLSVKIETVGKETAIENIRLPLPMSTVTTNDKRKKKSK